MHPVRLHKSKLINLAIEESASVWPLNDDGGEDHRNWLAHRAARASAFRAPIPSGCTHLLGQRSRECPLYPAAWLFYFDTSGSFGRWPSAQFPRLWGFSLLIKSKPSTFCYSTKHGCCLCLSRLGDRPLFKQIGVRLGSDGIHVSLTTWSAS